MRDAEDNMGGKDSGKFGKKAAPVTHSAPKKMSYRPGERLQLHEEEVTTKSGSRHKGARSKKGDISGALATRGKAHTAQGLKLAHMKKLSYIKGMSGDCH